MHSHQSQLLCTLRQTVSSENEENPETRDWHVRLLCDADCPIQYVEMAIEEFNKYIQSVKDNAAKVAAEQQPNEGIPDASELESTSCCSA